MKSIPAMIKIEKIILIIAIIILFLYVITRVTGLLSFYTVTSTSMEPNYPNKKLLVSTNWRKPKRMDVITYKSKSLEIPGIRPAEDGVFLGRLIGVGGDELEMKNGYAFINGAQIDKDINLKFFYSIPQAEFYSNQGYFQKLPPEDLFSDGINKMIALDDQFLSTLPIKDRLKRYTFNNIDANVMAKVFNKPGWTTDNLGPIKIPEGKVFILGDFRHNAEDARMKGFESEKNIIGVVIN